MKLYIDTTDFDKITYALVPSSLPLRGRAREGVHKKSYKIDSRQSFEILQKLEEFLHTVHCPLNAVHSIIVNKGPGSYTGTRIGVVHAEAISFALNIPVKFLEKEKFEKEIKKAIQ